MKQISVYLLLILLFSYSCKKDSNELKIHPVHKDNVTGVVQKGPFISGNTIILSELTSSLNSTGSSYHSNIITNEGLFEFGELSLSSQYIEIIANGFYFNEIKGITSSAQLTLNALVDISDKSSINVNIITTLEKERIKYLVQNGYSFNNAKQKAQEEIFKIFEIDTTGLCLSEELDIAKEGPDNAILLAISVILQGFRTESELTELIFNISNDIKEDGKLDNENIGSEMVNDVRIIDLTEVRNNIEERYSELQLDFTIPDFEYYINRFLDSTSYYPTNLILYPDSGSVGPNLLSLARIEYPGISNDDENYYYNATAIVPEENDIKVIFTANTPGCSSTEECGWRINPLESGWSVDVILQEPVTFEWEKDGTKDTLDMKLSLRGHGTATIDIYENNSSEITRTKDITW